MCDGEERDATCVVVVVVGVVEVEELRQEW